MMVGTHVAVAVAPLAVGTATILGDVPPLLIAAAALGSVSPDIDHPYSFIGRRLRFISVPLARALGHRGLSHSLAIVALLTAAAAAARHSALLAFAYGYLTHLLGDACTPSGVPLFYPKRQTYSLRLFKTGSPPELVIASASMMAILGVVYFAPHIAGAWLARAGHEIAGLLLF